LFGKQGKHEISERYSKDSTRNSGYSEKILNISRLKSIWKILKIYSGKKQKKIQHGSVGTLSELHQKYMHVKYIP
jgi:hypothetical protein